MSEICYRDKKFKPESMAIIDASNAIIETFQGQGYSLTLRQLYYQMVSRDIIPNNQKSYDRIGNIVSDARMAGLIDWEAIEDRGRNLKGTLTFDSIGHALQNLKSWYTIDKWDAQPNRLEVWVEKEALVDVIARAAEKYDVPYIACKGYMSQSEMHAAALRFVDYQEKGQHPTIIHLGDHDPSGIHMTQDIEGRITEFFEYYGLDDSDFTVERIALNMDQVRQYKPPPNPAKASDSRFEKYAAEFGQKSWELDALEPSVLDELVTGTIESYMDDEAWAESVKDELKQKSLIAGASQGWGQLENHLKGGDEEGVKGFLDAIRRQLKNHE